MRFNQRLNAVVVAPILISQCYNTLSSLTACMRVVAPILISQCYNLTFKIDAKVIVVAPILISQCYNTPTGNPYYVRVSRFICSEKMGLK